MKKPRRRATAPTAPSIGMPLEHADGGTARPEAPALDGRTPLPEEITGRSAGTDDDLVALFANRSSAHLADGFRGGSDDDPVVPDATRPDVARRPETPSA